MAAVARASLPGREAAALPLWPWGVAEQVTEVLAEAGVDRASQRDGVFGFSARGPGRREGREIRRPPGLAKRPGEGI